MAFILPTILNGLIVGDWAGGFYIVGVLRLVLVHHSTFCVNSLAHYLGDHTYTDSQTPRYVIDLPVFLEGGGEFQAMGQFYLINLHRPLVHHLIDSIDTQLP